ncbi:MAG: indole-3-glycerol phosphate synthase TrpC [Bacteroidales bacterium]|nr:indole-3-glycerol phosphate synthase TrpC [Bacteroidales bacterium]MCF8389484.1 indole-3-glycerol phosphate synthase TrpC [Bacteroidales bacterium]
MNILEKIVAHKRLTLIKLKQQVPVSSLESGLFFAKERPSFFNELKKNEPSVIAEFKRMSPSKGDINPRAEISTIIPQYSSAGAAAISVLTDGHFGGEITDLHEAALLTNTALLRKDFIIDEYQIIEAKAMGASAILLIASVLSKSEIKDFTRISHDMGLDVLLEIHDESELGKIGPENNIVGINSRNLKTFDVDIHTAIKLQKSLGNSIIKIAESGIKDVKTAKELYASGFNAFLIGELFMHSENPGRKAEDFIRKLKS